MICFLGIVNFSRSSLCASTVMTSCRLSFCYKWFMFMECCCLQISSSGFDPFLRYYWWMEIQTKRICKMRGDLLKSFS
ncbi:hypothetical protein SDJN03_18348, partial [Cucurbita argyrosperma subsp. sororia]